MSFLKFNFGFIKINLIKIFDEKQKLRTNLKHDLIELILIFINRILYYPIIFKVN